MSRSRSRIGILQRSFAMAVILTAIATIYYRSTSAYFFDDDFHWLAQTQVFDPGNMLDLSLYDHFYRPVIETYFFLGYSLFGCNPLPFHVSSVVIHAVTTILVALLALSLGEPAATAWPLALLAALFFAVQPGLVDAITWIGAVTDSLPVLFYVLTLVLYLRFLRLRKVGWYLATLCVFVICHLTHESAATLLPMMLLTEFTFVTRGSFVDRSRALARAWVRYAPFAMLLLAYLALSYVVNTRGYVVQEGHWRIGMHAVPNILNYVLWLYVGKRALVDYVGTITALVAILVFGTPRMRFAVVWIVLTLLPVSFFTWEDVPRYLYLPAVGFSLLVADLLLALREQLARRSTPRVAAAVTGIVVAVLAVRFGAFAKRAADSFPAKTAHYQRFVQELRRANPDAVAGSTVVIEQQFLEGVPELYREPAARVGLCMPGVRLEMR